METKHLPCPFCGWTDDPVRKNTRTFSDRKEVDYYLKCNGCGTQQGIYKRDEFGDDHCEYDSPEQALEFWNTRANGQEK